MALLGLKRVKNHAHALLLGNPILPIVLDWDCLPQLQAVEASGLGSPLVMPTLFKTVTLYEVDIGGP